MTNNKDTIRYILVCLLLPLLLSCGKTQTFSPDGNTGTGGGDNSGSADYSALTAGNHPRIIMTDEDVATIKAKIETDANLKKLHDYVISYADRMLTQADLEYDVTGGRLLSVSQAAGNRITTCAYAYRMTGESKYLERAEKDMQAVCAFPDWHTAHWLDTGEMAYAVGIGYDWLYNDLQTSTLRSAETAIRQFAFESALSLSLTASTSFYSMASNWNQVCNGGLVVAALAIYETASDEARQIIDRAVSTNRTAMQGIYGTDGNYPEGYGYWGYGTGFECMMLSAMESSIGYDYNLGTNEGFTKTGKYIMFMEGTTGEVFNYSDCSSSSIPFPALWYLADRFDDPSLLFCEVRKLDDGLYASYDSPRYYPMSIVHGSRFDLTGIAAPEDNIYKGDGINPVCLVRTDWTYSDTDKMLGIKAGRADYSHGHMDVGSFVYDAYGMRVSADLGLQSYGSLESYPVPPGYDGDAGDFTQNAFRWAVFRYNNYNHSTITVNNALHNVSGRAAITSVIDDGSRLGAVVDMSDILSDECADAVRTIYVEDNRDLVVIDEVQAMYNKAVEIRWTLLTKLNPLTEDGRIVLRGTERDLYLTVTSENGSNVELTTFPMTLNDWDQANPGFYEAGYTARVTSGKTETFTVRISPEE